MTAAVLVALIALCLMVGALALTLDGRRAGRALARVLEHWRAGRIAHALARWRTSIVEAFARALKRWRNGRIVTAFARSRTRIARAFARVLKRWRNGRIRIARAFARSRERIAQALARALKRWRNGRVARAFGHIAGALSRALDRWRAGRIAQAFARWRRRIARATARALERWRTGRVARACVGALERWRTGRVAQAFARVRARRRARRKGGRVTGGALRVWPIVLAHGFGGFDSIRLPGARQDYFRGVPGRLRALGVKVHAPRVTALASIAARAAQLSDQIRLLDAPRVNVVAHSMGGLDARYALAKLGLAERVAALVTVGTPHHGTPLADGGLNLSQLVGLRRALELVGADWSAVEDLTQRRMADFNHRVRDVAGVRYLSYVGRVREVRRANALLRPSWRLLSARVGPNDGLVPAESQQWGVVLGEIDADHWAQIGWGRHFDAAGFYVTVVEQLADTRRGLVAALTGAVTRGSRAKAAAPPP